MNRNDHNWCLKACADSRATAEEKEFLGFAAGLIAANEKLPKDDAARVRELTGSSLTVEGSIFDRAPTSRAAQGAALAANLAAAQPAPAAEDAPAFQQ